MFGRPGNGKSHLAGGIFNELAELGKTPIFASVPDLLKRLQATFEPDSRTSEHQFYDLLPQADAVILDDLGAEQSRAVGDKHVMTPWAESTLYYIVDCLYRWKKPLVVTTNCDLESLEERISPRTFDRLLEMCLIVENKATSYRKEQAFKRIKELR
jgi:DNA replication protein DnaC